MSTIALKQAAELHRKLRMTARFILGSLQDQANPTVIPREELSLVRSFLSNGGHPLKTIKAGSICTS
jgi:hypothetical protein